MAFEKKYLKSKPICKVKFIAPNELCQSAKKLTIAGEFNDWDTSKNPLRKQKDGSYATIIDLETNKEYEYRFVLDGDRWENDYTADKYVANNFSFEENSVVCV